MKEFRIVKIEYAKGHEDNPNVFKYKIEQRFGLIFHFWGSPEFAPPHLFVTAQAAYDYVKKIIPRSAVYFSNEVYTSIGSGKTKEQKMCYYLAEAVQIRYSDKEIEKFLDPAVIQRKRDLKRDLLDFIIKIEDRCSPVITDKGEHEDPATAPSEQSVCTLPGYQQRMLKESEDLEEKTAKLSDFINGIRFVGLDSDEQRDMQEQYQGMLIYKNALRHRLIRAGISDKLVPRPEDFGIQPLP